MLRLCGGIQIFVKTLTGKTITRSWIVRYHWQCEGKVSGQRGYSTRPTTSHLRWKEVRRWTHTFWLQYSGVDVASRSASAWPLLIDYCPRFLCIIKSHLGPFNNLNKYTNNLCVFMSNGYIDSLNHIRKSYSKECFISIAKNGENTWCYSRFN